MIIYICAFWACGTYAAGMRGYGFWATLCWPAILIGGLFDHLGLKGKKEARRGG